MGKAAQRRKTRIRKRLVEMSFSDPTGFERAWEMRLNSWLSEVSYSAERWGTRKFFEEHLFSVLDDAMVIISNCAPVIREKYYQETYETLCHECCTQLARLTDKRLYRPSNIDRIERHRLLYGQKDAGEY